MDKRKQQFCQSCGMPLTEEYYSTNADGSVNSEYCAYCYQDGEFLQEVTMDGMIEHCLEFLDEFNKDAETPLTREQAREQMRQFFPMLKRWEK